MPMETEADFGTTQMALKTVNTATITSRMANYAAEAFNAKASIEGNTNNNRRQRDIHG